MPLQSHSWRSLGAVVIAANCLHIVHSGSVLGVPPAEQSLYIGDTFRCKAGGSSTLPAAAINDNFCDCQDGSDEPGTGACAGQEQTLFFCLNEGSAPKQIYASRVADGVCDCCDGSDETFFTGRGPACANTCAAEGKKLAAERALRLEMVRNGVDKKKAAASKAATENKIRNEELGRLQAELPGLEKELEEARAEVEREAQKAHKSVCKDIPEACRWRQTGGCSPSGAREASKDKPCAETVADGNSGYCDCDGDGRRGEGEPGYNCSKGPGSSCCQACAYAMEIGALRGSHSGSQSPPPADGTAAADAAGKEGADAGEEKKVSEYAKWMDGAEAELADKDADAGEEKKVSEYAKWMEKADEDEEGEDEELADGGSGQAAAETGPSAASQKKKELEDKVRRNKGRIEELKQKLEALSSDHLGYAALDGKLITRKVGEFDYKLNFFADAKQGHTSLGKWGGWTGKHSGIFKGGTKCWEGPNRELTVNFQCGAEEVLEDVAEPSKCVYEAVVSHPGACEEAELQRISGDMSMEVIGPKMEL